MNLAVVAGTASAHCDGCRPARQIDVKFFFERVTKLIRLESLDHLRETRTKLEAFHGKAASILNKRIISIDFPQGLGFHESINDDVLIRIPVQGRCAKAFPIEEIHSVFQSLSRDSNRKVLRILILGRVKTTMVRSSLSGIQ